MTQEGMMVVDEVATPVAAPTKKVDFEEIVKTILYITKGVDSNQPRLLSRSIRQNASIRKYVTTAQLANLVKKYVPMDWPTVSVINDLLGKLNNCPQVVREAAEATASAESSSSSATSSSATMDVVMESAADVATSFAPVTSLLPEIETYLLTLFVTTLLRYKLDAEAAYASTCSIERIRTFNRRSMDCFASKAYFYFSLSYERIGKLEHTRATLLQLYRTACLRHDLMCQTVLLNLVLSNYLHFNLFERAHNFSLRAPFPENASNNQFCRYLFYMGRILATQLEYSEAYQRLLQASRKAPHGYALGFSVQVNKLIVLVQLLMGEIPERGLFNQPELRVVLAPYLALTKAVRNGDLVLFGRTVQAHKAAFETDGNLTLVQRLGQNVLKTGLRKISVSYSRIGLADVATKLHLPSAAAAEYVCAKAIRDGVIEARIEHTAAGESSLCSHDTADLYSTEEPQKAFHKRIAFCLDVHNEAVTSMRYPPDEYANKGKGVGGDDGKDKADEKTIEELIREMEDELDE